LKKITRYSRAIASINAQSTIALPKKLEQKNKSIATLLQRGLSFSRNFSARFFD
jgi:hypothetical protein